MRSAFRQPCCTRSYLSAVFATLAVGALVAACGEGGTPRGGADRSGGVMPGPAPIDLLAPDAFETATFGMGCFWGAEAQFGLVEGVIRTRVGYSGGTKIDPTYRDLGDHTETVQVDYDPAVVSYAELLLVFFTSHDCSLQSAKRQYMSAVFYHDAEQEKLAREASIGMGDQMGDLVRTEILPAGPLYMAEDYHQKYALQGDKILLAEVRARYPDFSDLVDSTVAARLNGYVHGLGLRSRLDRELESFGLSEKTEEYLLSLVG